MSNTVEVAYTTRTSVWTNNLRRKVNRCFNRKFGETNKTSGPLVMSFIRKRNRTNEDGTFLKHNKGVVNVDDVPGQ